MAWIYLVLAGLMEIVWATLLKQTDGFSRLTPSLITLAAMAASMILLSLAVKTLPMGTAYAIWTGIGAVGVAILGIILYHEPLTIPRVLCIGLIVAGIVGLKVWGK